MNAFLKERIYPVIFMALLTIVFIGGVSGIYLATADKVRLNENLTLQKAVLYAADIPLPEETPDIVELYGKRIREIRDEKNDIRYFTVLSENGEETGYIVFSSGPGLWGEITAVVGYRADRETMTGVDFIKQSETPGLGARIAEDWFREQFRGKKGPFKLVPEGTSAGPGEMDAITGATRTSVYVRNIINNSRDRVHEITE